MVELQLVRQFTSFGVLYCKYFLLHSIILLFILLFSSQPWSSSLVPNVQGSFTAQPKLPSQDTPNTPQETTAGSPLKAPPTEAKPVGRKELPAVFMFFYDYCMVHICCFSTFFINIEWSAGPLYCYLFTCTCTSAGMANFSNTWDGIRHAISDFHGIACPKIIILSHKFYVI